MSGVLVVVTAVVSLESGLEVVDHALHTAGKAVGNTLGGSACDDIIGKVGKENVELVQSVQRVSWWNLRVKFKLI